LCRYLLGRFKEFSKRIGKWSSIMLDSLSWCLSKNLILIAFIPLVEVLSNFQYLYVKTCVCFVSFRLWPHQNPLKLWGPSLCVGIIKKISMSQCVWWLINNFWTNGMKVIEFRVIFVIENELKFTNLGFNQLLHFHYIDPFVWPFTSHKKFSICHFYTSFHIKITIIIF
jgi:hypothetical protein